MKPETILQADMLDILFENRNKEYGAYLLRKGYNGRLLGSISGTAAIVATATILYFFLGGRDGGGPPKLLNIPVVTLATDPLPILKKPEPVHPKSAPRPAVATIPNATPVIVQEDVKIPPPTIEELDGPVAIGTERTNGVPGEVTAPPAAPAGKGDAPEKPPVDENRPLKIAEVMPEFPGGIRALQRFLQKNLMVPEGSVEPGQQLRIPVTFVVNREGELGELSFRDSVSESVRKEIQRVMRRMPKWKPGSQAGHPVAVYFTLPIIFAVEGE